MALERNDDRLRADAEKASARKLIEARENAFWSAKALGVVDLIDVVVPRASMPQFLRKAPDRHGLGRTS